MLFIFGFNEFRFVIFFNLENTSYNEVLCDQFFSVDVFHHFYAYVFNIFRNYILWVRQDSILKFSTLIFSNGQNLKISMWVGESHPFSSHKNEISHQLDVPT